MKPRYSLCLLLALAMVSAGADQQPTGFPFTDESLQYNINWPSGLNLG